MLEDLLRRDPETPTRSLGIAASKKVSRSLGIAASEEGEAPQIPPGKFQSSTLARVFRGGELGEQVQIFRIKYTVRAGDTSGAPPVFQSQDAKPLAQILSRAEKCLCELQ